MCTEGRRCEHCPAVRIIAAPRVPGEAPWPRSDRLVAQALELAGAEPSPLADTDAC
ncbi:hypothetical protein ACWEKT_35960 [Nocardia takedensis]